VEIGGKDREQKRQQAKSSPSTAGRVEDTEPAEDLGYATDVDEGQGSGEVGRYDCQEEFGVREMADAGEAEECGDHEKGDLAGKSRREKSHESKRRLCRGREFLAMRIFVLIACLMSLSCASASIPLTEGPADWAAIEDAWSLHVVTLDPDGDERVTRIWIAVTDGKAAIRSGESRWWANLQRDPRIRIRFSGTDYPFRAEFATAPDDKIRIDEIFLEKYGRWERMLFSEERGETHDNYAWLLPATGVTGQGVSP